MSEGLPVREGDMLAGKYRVERVLGAGGMGIVVSALHLQLDQRVAIKFVRDEALGNQDAVQRFLREARAAVKLKSEYAAKVLDVGTLDSGAPYMVMEYLEGSDLGAVLQEHGALTVEAAAEWIVQACEAIAEAHALGIIHRDIKPQNLFLAKTVGGQPKVKVLDFGVSKSLASSGAGNLTQTRAMLGSPLYMSPEQMRSSRDVDARSDVWALGIVLYELLTKRWPFEAESMPELCLKVVGEPPQSITLLRPDAPRVLVEVLDRCLQKNPALRFANAAELASALEPIAPPASRAIAERARLAIGTMPGSTATSLVPSSAISGPHVPPDVLARTALTPAAWDSNNGKTNVSPGNKRGRAIWIALGAVAAVAASVGLFALRAQSPSAPAAVQAPVPLTAAPPPPIPSALTLPAPAPSASAAATDVPTTSAVTAVAVAVPVVSAAPRAPVAVAPSATTAKPGAGQRPAPSGKPKPTDDDIPSLR